MSWEVHTWLLQSKFVLIHNLLAVKFDIPWFEYFINYKLYRVVNNTNTKDDHDAE